MFKTNVTFGTKPGFGSAPLYLLINESTLPLQGGRNGSQHLDSSSPVFYGTRQLLSLISQDCSQLYLKYMLTPSFFFFFFQRVTHAHRVPQDFHARFKASSRTYVYRIALGVSHHTLLPLTDWNLCWSLRNT